MKRKGFTLVELMVVVAIIAILAAISLPMYTRFKQKAQASKPIKVCMGLTQALQTWYNDEGTFANVALGAADATGASFITGTDSQGNAGIEIGTGIPAIDDVTWAVVPAANLVVITFTSSSTSCPDPECSGQYCLLCSDQGCVTEVEMGTVELGLNKQQDPNSPACP